MTDDAPEIIRPQPRQAVFLEHPADVVIAGGAAGGGKMMWLSTPIPTPTGWRLLKHLHAGDFVFGLDGKPTQILAESEVQVVPGLRLTFDDGSTVVCCEDHLWLTFDAKELSDLTRRQDDWRARRREHRKSRSNIQKWQGVSHSDSHRRVLSERITKWNREHPTESKPLPSGTVRSTKEIVATLTTKRGRRNHAIPICQPLQCSFELLPLDPYLLGVWLGDGTRTTGGITTGDIEIIEAFTRDGWELGEIQRKQGANCITVNMLSLLKTLRLLDVFDNKHIPDPYLWASESQRLALLQGLMDTDGSCDQRGRVEFTSTSILLADGVAQLVRSLGMKASVITGRAMLNGKDCGPKYRVNFSASMDVFRLPRKLQRLKKAERRTTKFRYIVAAERTDPVPMKCLRVSASDHLYLATENMIPTHNSFALLMLPLRYVDNPAFNAVIFRRTYPQILKPGGIWDDSKKLYQHCVPRPEPLLNPPRWRFPSGATISFQHLENDQTVYEYKSAQIPLIMWDQVEEMSEVQWWYLFSRNRSTSGVPCRIRATCNPDAESWLAGFLSWWIDQDTGYPNMERACKIRWMARDGDSLVWGSSRQEVIDKVGPECLPKSVSFVPAFLDDNPALLRKDPGYRANLQMLTTVERERLLKGNWKIRPQAGLVFPRDKWQFVESSPADTRWVRYIDKASHEGSAGARTAMVLTGVSGTGANQRFFVGDVVAGRWNDLEREDNIRATAQADRAAYGWRTSTWLEQEPGSGGKDSAKGTIRNLAGLDVHAVRARTAKQIAWKPAAAQVQAGNVYIVTGPKDGPSLWDFSDFIRELDVLAGDKEQDAKKLRDCADAFAGGFNVLTGTILSSQRELLCSGEPGEDRFAARQPLTDDEIGELPDDIASVLRDMRQARTAAVYGADELDDRGR